MDGLQKDMDIVAERISTELGQPVFPAAITAAEDIVALHGATVRAVVFYGSCLQSGSDEGKVLDFYVLVDDPVAANNSFVLGVLNTWLPPNVYYREITAGDRVIRSKYAVMALQDFVAAMQPGRFNPSFWARFAQPCALVWCSDKAAQTTVADAIVQAVATMVARVAPVFSQQFTGGNLWARGFELTYRAELRAENAEARGRDIYAQNAERYDALTEPAMRLAGFTPRPGEGGRYLPVSHLWRRRRTRVGWWFRIVHGKWLSFLRLLKGAFTFSGAIDYLAWKIRRHSGVEIEVKDWHRRHPMIGGLVLFFKTRRRGGFR